MLSIHLAILAISYCSDPYVRARTDKSDCPIGSTAPFVWWPAGCPITFNQDRTGANPLSGDVFGAVTKSLLSWVAIQDECGNLRFTEGPRIADRTVGYDRSSSNNTNVVLFRMQDCSSLVPQNDACRRDDSCGNKYDCWDDASNVIALTVTTYDSGSGRLLDADIELNAAGFKFTTLDTPLCPEPAPRYDCVATDVQNTATHEFGHALGLDHTIWRDPVSGQESTMSPTSKIGETSKRQIDRGSHQFVCDVYPKGAPAQDCQAVLKSSSCSASPGDPLLALAAWVLVWMGRRIRRRGC